MSSPALAVNVRGKGRHYEHPTTGELVPSVTNIIDVLDKPALKYWAANTVAQQAWKLRHTLDDLGEAEAYDILKGSPWRKSKRSAGRGTTIHEYLEVRANKRPLPELDGEALTYKPGADAFLKIYDPKFILTEATVFGDGYAGTFDALVVINGRTLIIDYKTGKALYDTVALQLAAARYASEVVVDGELVPLQEVDGCAGVLLTPDGCDVREVSTDGAYEAFLGCLAAWHWKSKGVEMTSVLWQ